MHRNVSHLATVSWKLRKEIVPSWQIKWKQKYQRYQHKSRKSRIGTCRGRCVIICNTYAKGLVMNYCKSLHSEKYVPSFIGAAYLKVYLPPLWASVGGYDAEVCLPLAHHYAYKSFRQSSTRWITELKGSFMNTGVVIHMIRGPFVCISSPKSLYFIHLGVPSTWHCACHS